MMNRFRLRPAAAALFVGSALLLAGCGQPGQEPGAAPASAGPEDSAPPSSAAPAPETESATGSESTAAAPETSSSAGDGDSSCSAGQLAASIKTEPGAGAAGSVYRTLVLTNTGDSSCTLAGYPGVSYVDAKGKQVGAPADRDSAAKTVTVTVAPGGTAAAQLRQTNAQNYGDECGLTDVAGVKIYPPNRKDSLIAEQETVGCSDDSVVLMTVGTFQAP